MVAAIVVCLFAWSSICLFVGMYIGWQDHKWEVDELKEEIKYLRNKYSYLEIGPIEES